MQMVSLKLATSKQKEMKYDIFGFRLLTLYIEEVNSKGSGL